MVTRATESVVRTEWQEWIQIIYTENWSLKYHNYKILGTNHMQIVLFRLDKFQLGMDTALSLRSGDKNVQAHNAYKNQSLFDFDVIQVDKLQLP